MCAGVGLGWVGGTFVRLIQLNEYDIMRSKWYSQAPLGLLCVNQYIGKPLYNWPPSSSTQ